MGARVAICLLVWLAACSDDADAPGGGASDAGPRDADGQTPGCPADCDDGLFCNGVERCDPGDPGADARGCVSPERACDDGIDCTVDACDEADETCTHTAPDQDGDGHGAATCLDADDEPLGDDCDDESAARFPGNLEVCDPDSIDEDCDARSFGLDDADGDGAIDARCCNRDADGALVCGIDCDDADLGVHGKQPEFCDSQDNDCDGAIDEVDNDVAWYEDGDGDGFGGDGTPQLSCTPIAGRSLRATDCDDADSSVHPASGEVCDGADNDCDGTADEALSGCATAPTEPPAPRVDECLNDLDDCHANATCTDTAGAFRCTCDGGLQGSGHGAAGCEVLVCSAGGALPFHADADMDGYGDPAEVTTACSAPDGYVDNADDCDDGATAIRPGAADTDCDQVDDDCDDSADEGHVPSVSCDAGDAAWLSVCEPTGLVCECVPGSADVPGDRADSDCDGFDGPIATSIFLAPGSGSDCTGAQGTTPADPCTHVQAAIDRAQSEGKQVIAAVGAYNSTAALTLRNGVSVYGGFDFTNGRLATLGRTIFLRQSAAEHAVAAVGSQLSATTRLVNLQFTATTPTNEGYGTYGLVCTDCAGLVLDQVTIVTEAGAKGVAGAAGTGAITGVNGGGGHFQNNGGATGGAGGAGRNGANTSTGYKGGNGGTAEVCNVTTNDMFYVGVKGDGPGGGNPASIGGTTAAQPGGPGTGAASAAQGGTGNAGWVPLGALELWQVSGTGNTGDRGNAGNGGGGGRAYCDYGLANNWYWSGGGGGGGGQGGFGGTGGQAGGSSIGLLLRDSAGVSLVAVDLQVGAGGSGGTGGNGGDGGQGGNAGGAAGSGPGGEPAPSNTAGAAGGRGGGAGGGGGGPGGASIPLMIDQASSVGLDTSAVTFSTAPAAASGGAGGPGGNQGAPNEGVAGEQGAAGAVCETFQVESTAAGTCL